MRAKRIFLILPLMSVTTPGLLLQAIPYLGQKKIVKIFTPEEGLVSIFANRLPWPPFCLAEWVYRKTEKEIGKFQDATLIDPFLTLKEDYSCLAAAGRIAQDLLLTQMPGKKGGKLFELARLYFKKLPGSPNILAASFRLKLLRHEGLLSFERDPSFTPLEWTQVEILAFSQSLSEIEKVCDPPYSKIETFFREKILST